MLKALALLAAVVAFGPALFRAVAWRPALAAAPPEHRPSLDALLLARLRPVAVAAAALLTAASLAALLGLAYTTAAGTGAWPGLAAVARSLGELVARSRVGLMTALRVAAGPALVYLLARALAPGPAAPAPHPQAAGAPSASQAAGALPGSGAGAAPSPAGAATAGSRVGSAGSAGAERLALVAGGFILLTFSVGGHAVDTPTRAGVAAAVLADLLHFVAACLWGGGLLALALAPWRQLAEPRLVPFAARLVRRFSALAALSVTVLVASGFLMASQRLYGILALFETRYGLDVVWKLALLTVALFFAKDNLLAVRPGLARAAAAQAPAERLLATLRARVLSEGLVLVLILLVAGFLTVTPPPWRLPREVVVTVHPDRYSPASLTWPRSKPVRLVLQNRDTTTHSFVIDGLRYEGLTSHVHGFTPTGTQFVLYAPPRQTVRAVLTPLQSGSFRFYDALQDFAERGLTGTVHVR